MRVACLQQALNEGEARQRSDARDAANDWLDKHWTPFVALQGTKTINACGPFSQSCTSAGDKIGSLKACEPLEGRGLLLADKMLSISHQPERERQVLCTDGDNGGDWHAPMHLCRTWERHWTRYEVQFAMRVT